jgi:hypothetical protein
MAAQAKSREAASLAKDAMQWRDLARQAEDWERVRSVMTDNLRQQPSNLLPPAELSD